MRRSLPTFVGASTQLRTPAGGVTTTRQPSATGTVGIAAAPGGAVALNVSHPGVPVSRWQYDIAPSGGGCTVTESTWDRRPGWYKTPAGLLTGVMNRTDVNAAHIQATLERLKK